MEHQSVEPPTTRSNRLAVVGGVLIILAVTAALVVGTGVMLFNLDRSDGGPPEVAWQVEGDNPPHLVHGGGDPVECERLFIAGDLGSGESLCVYFDTSPITEGDTAALWSLEDRSGSFVLQWEDTDTGQVYDLTEPFQIE